MTFVLERNPKTTFDLESLLECWITLLPEVFPRKRIVLGEQYPKITWGPFPYPVVVYRLSIFNKQEGGEELLWATRNTDGRLLCDYVRLRAGDSAFLTKLIWTDF